VWDGPWHRTQLLSLDQDDALVLPADAVFLKCRFQRPATNAAQRSRSVCLSCLNAAGFLMWESGKGRNEHFSHRCNDACDSAIQALKSMMEAKRKEIDEREARRKQNRETREKADADYLQDAARWGRELAERERNCNDGRVLVAFLSGYFDTAEKLVRNRKSDYKPGYKAKLALRKTFIVQLLARTVRPQTPNADLVDGLTAMASMPGLWSRLVDVLGALGLTAFGRDHSRRMREAVTERIMKRYDAADKYGYVGVRGRAQGRETSV
jgi:hypothetical protein